MWPCVSAASVHLMSPDQQHVRWHTAAVASVVAIFWFSGQTTDTTDKSQVSTTGQAAQGALNSVRFVVLGRADPAAQTLRR